MEILIEGKIVKGRGKGVNVVGKINEKLESKKIRFFQGTLNIVSTKPFFFDVDKADFILFKNFYFYKVKIENVECYVYRWLKCPGHVFEVLSECYLKEELKLKDNQTVSITICKSFREKFKISRYLFWWIFWEKRTHLYYKFDLYEKFVGRVIDLKYKYIKTIIVRLF
ncbi:DUF120 domain-containing protein [Rhodonellum sp.]|uniref:DUF120 domain-containing protein n=1 Tax=Rhodonellum sp. TaxID=2231180 RepID=UPI0027281298|nr:DUF120 domain-containing protein [Rhodonellum sp.]MDO9554339.1 DUF120 domain-containing protein [Rhodonellum sp.]